MLLKVPGTALVPTVPELHRNLPAPVKKKRFWLWWTLGFASLAIAGLAYSLFGIAKTPSVVVEIAKLEPVTRVLAVNGRIAAVHSVDVRPLVSGTLKTLPVVEGDKVSLGQVLGIVNAEKQNTIVRQAMAGLDSAIVAQQKATEAYSRAVQLGSNIARTVLETNEHAVRLAEQEVARQTALMDQANITLQNHTIQAPITGSILLLNVNVGQVVDLSTVLLTLADLRELVVETNVDEAYAGQIEPTQPAVLQLAGETGTYAGHVSYVSTRVDVATGGLALRITFDEPIKAPVGMTVTTNILVERQAAALTLPRTAIVSNEAGTGFFVVEEGKVRLRPVSLVDWPAARLIVTSGLSEGDVVILDATGISDSMSVEMVNP